MSRHDQNNVLEEEDEKEEEREGGGGALWERKWGKTREESREDNHENLSFKELH